MAGRSARGPRGWRTRSTTLPRLAPIVDLDPGVEVAPTAAPRARAGRAGAALAPAPDAAVGPAASGSPSGSPASGSRTASSTLAHRQPLGDRPAGQRLLEAPVGRAEQGPGVAGGEPAVGHQLLDRRRELEQAQGVGDRRPALADPRGDLLVGEPEVLDELLVGGRLLEGVEVLAVEVLDQGLLERRRCRRSSRTRAGIVCEAGPLGRPPAALAGDELEAAVARPAARGPAGARRARGSTRSARPAPPRRSAAAAGGGWARCWPTGSSSERRLAGARRRRRSGMRAPRPLPSPLRRATAHLLGQLPVGDGAPRGRIERDDRLPERRRLGEPHRAGDDVAADLVAEVLAHLLRRPGRPAWSGRRT